MRGTSPFAPPSSAWSTRSSCTTLKARWPAFDPPFQEPRPFTAYEGMLSGISSRRSSKVVAERQMKSPTLYSWPSFTSRDRESARVPFFGAAGPGLEKSPTRKSGRSAKHAREGSQVFRMKYGSCLSLARHACASASSASISCSCCAGRLKVA